MLFLLILSGRYSQSGFPQSLSISEFSLRLKREDPHAACISLSLSISLSILPSTSLLFLFSSFSALLSLRFYLFFKFQIARSIFSSEGDREFSFLNSSVETPLKASVTSLGFAPFFSAIPPPHRKGLSGYVGSGTRKSSHLSDWLFLAR